MRFLQPLRVAYNFPQIAEIAPQIPQIFVLVDGSKHLNTLYLKNLRNLRGNLRDLREIKFFSCTDTYSGCVPAPGSRDLSDL